jgi:hypothetical protein
VPPGLHRRNAAERAIRTVQNHFIAGLCSVDPNFPIHLWDRLVPQAEISLNLLRGSWINPKLLLGHKSTAHSILIGRPSDLQVPVFWRMKSLPTARHGHPMLLTAGTLAQHWIPIDAIPCGCGIPELSASVIRSPGSLPRSKCQAAPPPTQSLRAYTILCKHSKTRHLPLPSRHALTPSHKLFSTLSLFSPTLLPHL